MGRATECLLRPINNGRGTVFQEPVLKDVVDFFFFFDSPNYFYFLKTFSHIGV